MRVGISSYCLLNAMLDKTMDIFDIMDWAKAHDCEHFELVPFELNLILENGDINRELLEKIKAKSKEIELPLSAFSLNSDVLKATESERLEEIARIKKYIDIAHILGIQKMRHDSAAFRRPFEESTPHHYEECFPILVQSARECADYALELGMNTTLENHGFFVNGADRVIRLIEAVDRSNVKMTLDVGNFSCVDEINAVSVQKCIPYADMIHLKDFYVRDKAKMPIIGERFGCRNGNWFETVGGSVIRGAILGQGDLDIHKILSIIKNSNYDSDISLEFEGMEDCLVSTEIGLNTARIILDSI